MNQPREDLARLASYVISARIKAGYPTRKDFAAAIGVTARTLGKLETASEEVSGETLARVSAGVGWTPDSPALILAGGEPKPDRSLSLVAGVVPDPDEVRLSQLVRENPDDIVVQAIAAQHHKSARMRADEITEWVTREQRRGNGTAG